MEVIFIIGGLTSGDDASIEILYLGEDDFECRTQDPLPESNADNIGLTDESGRPMSCGGRDVSDPSACVKHYADDNPHRPSQWADGPSMLYDRQSKGVSVLLSDGRYFVSGGDPL